MVISSSFRFLRIFYFPLSFNSIYFYLGWFWAPSKVQSGVYQAIIGHISNGEVFHRSRKISVNTVTFLTVFTTSVYFGRKMFFQNRNVYPSNDWFITVITFSSVGLLRNNYFEISYNAPSNSEVLRCVRNDCEVFSLLCVAIVISEPFFCEGLF